MKTFFLIFVKKAVWGHPLRSYREYVKSLYGLGLGLREHAGT